MKRLSRPAIELKGDHFTVVVVGSGYGGSIVASRMARAGVDVCLLERGREIHPGEYAVTRKDAIKDLQVDTQVKHFGSPTALYDFRVNDDVQVFLGCGLGGTSLVNAGVALRADPDVFKDPRWPTGLRQHVQPLGGSQTLLDWAYACAVSMLQPLPYPADRWTWKLAALARSAAEFRKEGFNFPIYCPPINVTFEDRKNAAGIEQLRCTDCGDCVSGCNVGAKNTTLMNYLPDAVRHGAKIYTEAKVTHVRQSGAKWIAYFEPQSRGEKIFNAPPHFVTADFLFLSCGTLGSTEILLRSREKGLSLSDKLGERFTGNGDVLGFGYNTDTVIQGIGLGKRHVTKRNRVGPCITGVVDLRDKNKPLEQRMVIEEGAIPGPLASVSSRLLPLTALFYGRETKRSRPELFRQAKRALESVFRGPYTGAVRNTQTFLVMSHDQDGGRMYLEDDRIRIQWPHEGEDWNFERIDQTLFTATDPLGGVYLKDFVWSKTFEWKTVTVHPLGGCIMSDSAQDGVVNHQNQVFRSARGDKVYEKLFVCDGSVIPTSLGVNPLLTISALTERCCLLVAQHHGWQIKY